MGAHGQAWAESHADVAANAFLGVDHDDALLVSVNGFFGTYGDAFAALVTHVNGPFPAFGLIIVDDNPGFCPVFFFEVSFGTDQFTGVALDAFLFSFFQQFHFASPRFVFLCEIAKLFTYTLYNTALPLTTAMLPFQQCVIHSSAIASADEIIVLPH